MSLYKKALNFSVLTGKGTSCAFNQKLLCSCAVPFLITQLCLTVTLWTVAHWAPLATGILQARILEWVARPSLLFSYVLYRRHHFCRMKTALLGGNLASGRKKPTAGAGASGLQCVGMMWLQKSVKLMKLNTLTTLIMKPNINILRKDKII